MVQLQPHHQGVSHANEAVRNHAMASVPTLTSSLKPRIGHTFVQTAILIEIKVILNAEVLIVADSFFVRPYPEL